MGGIVLLAIAQTVLSPTDQWEASAWVNPETGSPRPIAPFPVPPINPMAMYGSPTGITLSSMLAHEANTTQHGGVTELSQRNFLNPIAGMAYRARKGVELHGHVHVSDEHIDMEEDHSHGEGADDHDHHDHHGEEVELGKEAIAYGSERMMEEIKLAFMLDPSNPMAARVLSYVCERLMKGPPVVSQWHGRSIEIPRGVAASMDVMAFHEASLNDVGGMWPEQTLARAWLVRHAWLTKSKLARFAKLDDGYGSAPEELRSLRAAMAPLVARSMDEWDAAIDAGRFRTPESAEEYSLSLQEAVSFIEALDERLKEVAASGKSGPATSSVQPN